MGKVLKIQRRPDGSAFVQVPPRGPKAPSAAEVATGARLVALEGQLAAVLARPAERPEITFAPTIQPAAVPEASPLADPAPRLVALEASLAAVRAEVAGLRAEIVAALVQQAASSSAQVERIAGTIEAALRQAAQAQAGATARALESSEAVADAVASLGDALAAPVKFALERDADGKIVGMIRGG